MNNNNMDNNNICEKQVINRDEFLKLLRKGDLEGIKKAHQDGIELERHFCGIAVRNGHFDCLKYLVENGCRPEELSVKAAVDRGSLEMLKYIHDVGQFPLTSGTCLFAASHGHLDILKYAHELGYFWDQQTIYVAAKQMKIDCLQYAIENGCPQTNLCQNAVKNDDPFLLAVFLKYGLTKDKWITYYAAANETTDCLEIAVKYDCPWHEKTSEYAVKYDREDCLKYAIENGCPYDKETYIAAIHSNNLDCMKYLDKLQCPTPNWTEININKIDEDVYSYFYEKGTNVKN